MKLEPGRPADRSAVEAFLAEHNALRVARRGELVSSLDHPTLLAKGDDDLVGVATYVIDAGECELLTLHAHRQFQGIGTALVDAVEQFARQAGCARVWLVTTNDNVDALRFYQRRGFGLCAVRPQAVTWSRQTLKPEIPTTGSYGIELRDELELAKDLEQAAED
ncbi:MAG: GNAT family N-acetyltransferase [Nocardioides sp.]